MNTTDQFKRLLALRRWIRSHAHLGMIVEKSTYGLGWKIKHTSSQWTLWTLYLDQFGGWSFYRAIPDLNRAVDCEDEKLIVQTNEWWALEMFWASEWYRFIYGEPSRVIRGTWEGKLAQKF